MSEPKSIAVKDEETLIEAQGKRGSLWHRWDPHIHTPGTVLNDQYAGPDPWSEFLAAIETSNPPIRALGITDYFGIGGYEQTLEEKRKGRLPGVGLIFPNVELRLSMETSKASAVNIHLLFSPHDHDHVDRIKRFLLEFEFAYMGESYRCQSSDLIRLGRAHRPGLTDDEAARSEGANQFKVSLEQLRNAWSKHEWIKTNALIAVAGGEKDGSSGLRDASGSFAAQRKNVESLANIIFSANPKQVRFWLGKESASVEELETHYKGCKPCLHGSDAHSLAKAGEPDGDRRCWIKGDLMFDTLRQVCIEPEERVFIGAEPPRGALEGHAISSVSVTNAPWVVNGRVDLNPGLVAVIGARGSGKTALADLIAAGGLAVSPHLNERSFILRAKKFLRDSRAELAWGSGEITGNELAEADTDDFLGSPYVQYLSQQFVDQLCSADGLSDSLIGEIERVIFNSHPINDRRGTDCFQDLLSLRLESSRQKRRRQQHALEKASANLTEERVRKDSLRALEKDHDHKRREIAKDKNDLKSLVAKGNEDRARRHEQVSLAVEAKRKLLDQEKRRYQTLIQLREDVQEFREVQGPSMLAELKDDRDAAALSSVDWEAFRLDYVGSVDAILAEHIRDASRKVADIQGSTDSSSAAQAGAEPITVPIPESVDLADQTLSQLEHELARLGSLVGADVQNAKRFSTLSEKITKAEVAQGKLLEQIERAKGAEERIRSLVEARRKAYCAIFEAIVEEELELTELYAPVKARIDEAGGSLSKLAFSVRRNVDMTRWTARGEALLDLRTNGPFKGRGELLRSARAALFDSWSTGSAGHASNAVFDFVKANEAALRTHMPENADFRSWARDISDWLYSTDHISVGYGLQFDGVDIEQLSPGTRGIVMLLLYLALDAEDDRPLIIDQPEENLDPQSIYRDLVFRFRSAKKRRQIIIVTHNANLVVNTDADQVIVAHCGPHTAGQLPSISYESGSLENAVIRQYVCDILEGGELAFKERAKRLRVTI